MTKPARYDFGRNWREFSEGLTDSAIGHAKADFLRLVGDPSGKTLLDIGSGSGLHSLSALLLGARSVTAFDYDGDSVETTRQILTRHGGGGDWSARRGDILDPGPIPAGPYDIVYSWGVLHHTGDMWRALENAAGYVADGGLFAVALYRKTPMCRLWWYEKRLYARHPAVRPIIRPLYAAALLAAHALRGRNPWAFVRNYESQRGMSFMHDVDDWLGGFPYESVAEPELIAFMQARGFSLLRSFNTKSGIGLFGTGCGEWVFRKRP